MNRLIVGVLVVVFSAGVALAAENNAANNAEKLILPAKNGNVEFSHKKHQDNLKSCMPCHEKKPGKIEMFGKDFAHKTCRGCHESRNAGPTKCPDCHKKQ